MTPIAEAGKLVTHEFLSGPDVQKVDRKEITEWNFWGVERVKRFTIQPQWLFTSFKEYSTYTSMRDDFLTLANASLGQLNIKHIGRLGLRYINEIRVDAKHVSDPLNWDGLINEELLNSIRFRVPDANPIRLFNNLEYSFGGFQVRFRFGLYNPDYPAQIKQRVFVLDYDAFYRGLLDINDIESSLDQYHSAIEALFERSIEEGLRRILNDD